MLTVCSGGQTGADIGGLVAAKRFGLPTKGYIPKGFITYSGPKPEYAAEYGLVETTSNKYQPRTYANAKLGDGTVRFASDFSSPGEICTLKAIQQYKKPHIDVDVEKPIPPKDVAKWIMDNNIYVLNVAGNREAGIQKFVEQYLEQVFTELGYTNGGS